MRAAFILIAVLSAGPALAFDTTRLGQGGSLSLDEIMPMIGKTPRLKAEVDKALAELNKKPDDILCSGMRFPGAWKELGGLRVSPYQCEFGPRQLEIKTTVRVTSAKGKVFDKPTAEARRRAANVVETNPKWTWTKP